jgi:predicted DNA-binding transcriptional regulator YafY
MYHPTTRVLTILELLQAHPRLSGAEIAAHLEVDRRTVRRYITMLGDLGIPIETERGRTGGYRLRRGFKLPPLMLSNDEAFAMTLSLIAARSQGLPSNPHTIASALAKLQRILPEALGARVQAVQSVVTFSPPPAAARPDEEVVLLISTAAAEGRRVVMRYQSRSATSERSLDPYGVLRHWSNWYVVGWCYLRGEVRVFRLDRVLAATAGPETFARPPAFDPLAFFLEAQANLRWGWSAEILLETSLAAARQRFSPGSAVLEQAPDGVVLRINVESLDWLARLLLTLECPFVIRAPAELRDALREVARQAAALADR